MNPAAMILHFFCTAYMSGIIWFVQLVHYPMLHHSDGAEAAAGHREYTRRMGGVVMPVMLTELGLQVFWLIQEPGWISATGAALLGMIWLSTFCLQVPSHRKLEAQFERRTQARLVRGNWIRTLGWTLRALLLGCALASRLT